MLYLAAAVSDFYIPNEQMVRSYYSLIPTAEIRGNDIDAIRYFVFPIFYMINSILIIA